MKAMYAKAMIVSMLAAVGLSPQPLPLPPPPTPEPPALACIDRCGCMGDVLICLEESLNHPVLCQDLCGCVGERVVCLLALPPGWAAAHASDEERDQCFVNS